MNDYVIITGHPRCGSGYMAELFTSFGYEVGHEKWEKYGISSWQFAVDPERYNNLKALYISFGPMRSRNLRIKHLIHHVRDPLNAIPSIVGENETSKESYNYRKRIIYYRFGVNLDDYTPINRASLSFLFWNKIVEEQNPELVVRVEDAIEITKQYIKEILKWDAKKIKNYPPTNYNARKKVKVDWKTLKPEILNALDEFCFEYGYQELSKSIESLNSNKIEKEKWKEPEKEILTKGMIICPDNRKWILYQKSNK